MRAFMSDRTLRLPISETADPAGVCGTAHNRASLAEAHRILPEAEPWSKGGVDWSAWPQRWTMLGKREDDGGPERACRDALADALRAWLEE